MATVPTTPAASSASGIAAAMVATLLSTTNQVTNLTPGGVLRAVYDGVSQQLASLQQQQGVQFSATANSVGAALYQVPLLPALGSTYLLTWSLAASAAAAITLRVGTLAAVPTTTLQWNTSQTVILAPGTSVTVAATGTSTGTVTNVPAQSITQVVQPVTGLTVTNASAQPTQAGRDAETPMALQARIQNKVAQNQRGTTNALAAGALLTTLTDGTGAVTEAIVAAHAYDYALTAAYPNTNTWVYVFNGTGPASATLLSTAQGIINVGYTDANGTVQPGFKAGGIFATCVDAPELVQPVSAAITLASGYTWATVVSAVQTAVIQWIANVPLGSPWIVSQLTVAILAVPGVADATVTTPSTNLGPTVLAPVPTQAPSLSVMSSDPTTSLAAGTYTVAYALQTPSGLTPPSPSAMVTLTTGQAISATAPALPLSVSPDNTTLVWYCSEAAGSSTIRQAATTATLSINLTALPPSSAAPPVTTNTAMIQGWAWLPGTITLTHTS